MESDDELSVRVRIPHGADLDPNDLHPDMWCVLVPGPLVGHAIDTLQAMLALWRHEEGNEPDDDEWAPLLAAAGYVLGGLLHAQATRHTREGARRLVRQVGRSWGSGMRRHLEALRRDPETDYIAEALLTLHQEAERRHKERLRQNEERWRKEREEQKHQQAAAEQGQATNNDVGWDF
jgi:hypothetical protein